MMNPIRETGLTRDMEAGHIYDMVNSRLMDFEFDVYTCDVNGGLREKRETLFVKGLNELDAKVRMNQDLKLKGRKVAVTLDHTCWRINIAGDRVQVEFKEEVPVGKSRRLMHNKVLSDICAKYNLNMIHQSL